jgi:hypothetical protein
MNEKIFALAIVLGSALLASTPVFAKQHQPPCSEIQRALKAGKTDDQVAKEMKVPLSRVKSCTHAGAQK